MSSFQQDKPKCIAVLVKLMKFIDASTFLDEVEWDTLELYTELIERPLALRTVESLLLSNKIQDLEEFMDLVHTVFTNCLVYWCNTSISLTADLRYQAYNCIDKFHSLLQEHIGSRAMFCRNGDEEPMSPIDVKRCRISLDSILKLHDDAIYFVRHPNKYGIKLHNYDKEIKYPIHFGIISRRINTFYYRSIVEYQNDMQLTFNNCKTYYTTAANDVTMLNRASSLQRVFSDEIAKIIKMKDKQIANLYQLNSKENLIPASASTSTTTSPKSDTTHVHKSSTTTTTTTTTSRRRTKSHPKGFVSLQNCKKLLLFIMNQDVAIYFNTPVDWQGLNLTDYPTIIKNPMDLGTVEQKLNNNEYRSNIEFCNDVNLVFDNCLLYNVSQTDVFPIRTYCTKLKSQFEREYNKLLNGNTTSKLRVKAHNSATLNQNTLKKDETWIGWKPQCVELLARLMALPEAAEFNSPLRWRALNMMDYRTLIKRPMDLGTVNKKLTTGFYQSPSEFASDIRLVFSNCLLYNKNNNNPAKDMAKKLREHFELDLFNTCNNKNFSNDRGMEQLTEEEQADMTQFFTPVKFSSKGKGKGKRQPRAASKSNHLATSNANNTSATPNHTVYNKKVKTNDYYDSNIADELDFDLDDSIFDSNI